MTWGCGKFLHEQSTSSSLLGPSYCARQTTEGQVEPGGTAEMMTRASIAATASAAVNFLVRSP